MSVNDQHMAGERGESLGLSECCRQGSDAAVKEFDSAIIHEARQVMRC